MTTISNFTRNLFIASTIIGSAMAINAQSSERTFNDAEAFNLKGHVKECVTLNESQDTISFVSFCNDGYFSIDDNDFVYRDDNGRITRMFSANIEYIDSLVTENGETIEVSDFAWDRYNLICNEKVKRILNESEGTEFSVYAETYGVEFLWKDNKVTKVESYTPGSTYIWNNYSKNFLCHGTGWWQASSFEYDKKGNVITEEIEYRSYKEIYTYKYLEFDSHGNWTKRKVSQNGISNETSIQTRNITYYE